MSYLRKGPVTAKEFKAAMRWAKASPTEKLAVGVSGDADSLALCLLLKQYAGADKVVAFTVDHNWEPQSGIEAVKVGEKLKSLGIEHHILKADWSQSGSGLCDSDFDPPLASKPDSPFKVALIARNRRLALLSRACRDHGINSLLFATKLDDQVRMGIQRLARNSGLEGLSGLKTVMPEVPVMATAAKHVRLVRPLLSFPKERLEATCKSHQLSWCSHPFNSLIYPRPDGILEMVQQMEAKIQEEGDQSPLRAFSRQSYARLMLHMEEHRQKIDQTVQKLIQDHSLRDPPTGTCFLHVKVRAGVSHWLNQPHLARRVISHVVRWAGTFDTPVSSKIAEEFRLGIMRFYQLRIPGKRYGLVVGGGAAMCPPRHSQTGSFVWVFARQPFNPEEKAKATIECKIGDTALWDRRFFVALRTPGGPGYDPGYTFFGVPRSSLNFVIRPFTAADYQSIVARVRGKPHTEWGQSIELIVGHYWRKMPPAVRETIPCVALKQDNGDDGYVVAVPSLNINLEPMLVDVKLSFHAHTVFEKAPQEVPFKLLEDSDVESLGGSS